MRGNGFLHARNVDKVLCSFRINDTLTRSKYLEILPTLCNLKKIIVHPKITILTLFTHTSCCFKPVYFFFVGIIVLYLQIIVTMDCQVTKRQSGEQLWVQCLTQGPLSRGIKGGEIRPRLPQKLDSSLVTLCTKTDGKLKVANF